VKKVQIYLADDHLILRDGLKSILNEVDNFEVIGESGNGKIALEEIGKLKPDIAILDISMPSMTGIEITRQVRKYFPEIKILVLSQYDNEEYIEKLLGLGVHAYLLKDSASDELIKAIQEVLEGNNYLSPRITKKVISGFSRTGKTQSKPGTNTIFDLLSAREIEILKLIAEGVSNDAIAKSLILAPTTVRTHRAKIMSKLNIHNVTDLIKYSIKAGLIDI